MKILLIGSGGREHAIAHSISKSKKLSQLFIAPGNAGTQLCGQNAKIDISNFSEISKFIKNNAIDMLVVGPEIPLVNGLKDFLFDIELHKDLLFIGPDKEGAQLEGSKAFSKKFMIENNIPTAQYVEITADNIEKGYQFIESRNAPYVLKADGLAAGKGVLILQYKEEAKEALQEMLDGKFGNASSKVVIEDFLEGLEFSVFVLTDGENYKILPSAKDYKKIGENDTGLNTGGMGAVSPVPFIDDALIKRVEEETIKPTLSGLKKAGIAYTGFLFLGFVNTAEGPKLLEYNVRMGDPETQVVFPKIKTDAIDLFEKAASHKLNEIELEIETGTAVTVVCASMGYPTKYEKGMSIIGLENIKESQVFHAGTKQENDKIVTNGGRVLAVTSIDNDISKAAKKSYDSIQQICYSSIYYRKDIGKDLLS